MSTLLKQQSITTLSRPAWLITAGMSKGIQHDRQHLGIILAAGEKIKIRQTNPDFNTPLVLRLLNDDSATESSTTVENQWKELTATAAAVPFIDTPYVDGSPAVEIEYPRKSKVLPVFNKNDFEVHFFHTWRTQNAEFALITMPYATILIPSIDMAHLNTLASSGGINGLIDYYNSIFTHFNALAGVSFEPAHSTDRNIANRYFMKADKHGAGGAYYGTYWAAQSSSSIRQFWLTPSISNWGCLHEIGHGYQGKFGSDKSFYTGEIWNNIYAVCWQHTLLGERKYKDGGLYDGKQERLESGVALHIANRNPVANWGLGQRLFFFMLMIDAAGKNAFTHFHQGYRLNINSPDYVPEDHPILDRLSHSFTRSGSQVDVTPFMKLVGAPITDEQCDRNLFSKARAVYPLNQLFQGDVLKEQQKALKLGSHFTLVETEQLLPGGLTGSITLKFEIDDFNQIHTQILGIMDGPRHVRQLSIDTMAIFIPDLPVGVYALRLPTGKSKKYQPQLSYLIVKPGTHTVVAKFHPRVTSALATQKFWILGRGNWSFGWLLVDHYRQTINLSITKDTPHSSYPNGYARFIIKNTQGQVIFDLSVPGAGATVKEYEIPFEPGYEIKIEHQQDGGFKSLTPGIIDKRTKGQTWQITKLGLMNLGLNNNVKEHFLSLLENRVNALRSDAVMLNAPCFAKVEIYLALQLLDSPEREILMEDYADCLPLNN